MSGDQALPNSLLPYEKPAEKTEIKDILRKSIEPNNVIVRVNGVKIQSSLNPNALEFIPSYLQNKPQIKLNEELRKCILRDTIDRNLTQESRSENQQHFINQSLVTKNINNNENKEFSKDINKVEELEETDKSSKDNEYREQEANLNVGKPKLYMLFASPSEVKHTSSETEISEGDSEPGNKVIENKDDDLNEVETNDLKTEESASLNAYISNNINDNINEILEVNPENVNKANENLLSCVITSTDNTDNGHNIKLLESKSAKPQLNVHLLGQTKREVQNIKVSNKDSIKKACNSRGQNNIKISKEPDPKTKLNFNSKIRAPQVSKVGTVENNNISTKPNNEVKECIKLNANVEARKVIKLKTPTTIVQNCKLAKSSKIHFLATTTNPKTHNLMANKPILPPLKKPVVNSVNKIPISNRSSSSTDKTSPSTKSSTQGSRIKSNENPKIKENATKSPRPTVSSKLRKTETQKRRNLFFDLDTIKMSDFLFK